MSRKKAYGLKKVFFHFPEKVEELITVQTRRKNPCGKVRHLEVADPAAWVRHLSKTLQK